METFELLVIGGRWLARSLWPEDNTRRFLLLIVYVLLAAIVAILSTILL